VESRKQLLRRKMWEEEGLMLFNIISRRIWATARQYDPIIYTVQEVKGGF